MSLILTETLSFNQANMSISEAESPDVRGVKRKYFYLDGIVMQAGIQNRNGRIYPESEIRRAVEDLNSMIQSGEPVLGEIDHPMGEESAVVSLGRTSHIIESIRMDGQNAIGRFKILPTPSGEIASTLLENGVKIGVSSRGTGSVSHSGVVSDYKILTIDLVARPSAPASRPNVIYEGLNGRTRIVGPALPILPKSNMELKEELRKWLRNK